MASTPIPAIAVLVVEDEALIRMEAVAMLEEAGYTVHEAAHAHRAIALLEKHRDIRLVFTDIHMPGSMDGLKLARYVRDRWPPVKIIMTSGQVHPSAEAMPAGTFFCPKPCPDKTLLGKIREMTASL